MTLPNFLIIGAAKSGTTSLYYYLSQHPEIYMSPVKEPYFFAIEGEGTNFQGLGNLKNFKYVKDIETYSALFDKVSNELAIGEASTWYLYKPQAVKRIKYYIPEAKLIAMLRNPVDRAYSQFTYMISEGREPLMDFSQALEAESKRISNNWLPWWHYKQRGFYYQQLKRYFETFNHEQIKVYLYEEFKDDSITVLQDIFNFLGVDNRFVPEKLQKHNVTYIPQSQTINQLLNPRNSFNSTLRNIFPSQLRKLIKSQLLKLNKRQPPSLKIEVRKELVAEYREDILKLQDLIQKDLSHWLKV